MKTLIATMSLLLLLSAGLAFAEEAGHPSDTEHAAAQADPHAANSLKPDAGAEGVAASNETHSDIAPGPGHEAGAAEGEHKAEHEANAGEHGGGHQVEGIPTAVYLQAVNFAMYAALLFFLLRKPVKAYFQGRETAFNQALVRAKHAKEEAEQKKLEVQQRLSTLQSSADQQIRDARAEAESLKAKIVSEAQDMAKRMREEANRSATIEIERAKNELREELLNQSVALSKKILQEKMAEPDQKRLQTEFVDKIGVRS